MINSKDSDKKLKELDKELKRLFDFAEMIEESKKRANKKGTWEGVVQIKGPACWEMRSEEPVWGCSPERYRLAPQKRDMTVEEIKDEFEREDGIFVMTSSEMFFPFEKALVFDVSKYNVCVRFLSGTEKEYRPAVFCENFTRFDKSRFEVEE